MLLLSSDFFQFFLRKFLDHYESVNSVDPDQDRHSAGPDLGPICLQKLSADYK